jgi:hypothetical protein
MWWSCQHLNATLNCQYKHSHEAINTSIQPWTVNKNTYMNMWVLVLNFQDCIKVVRVSCEFFYWLFRIVLRWWEFHVSVLIVKTLTWNSHLPKTILNSQYKHSHETFTTLIQSWTVNKRTHMKLFRIVLGRWEFPVSVFIDCSGLY